MENKYKNVKTEIDWIKFSSKLEARFYNYFKSKWIEILELQPRFLLQSKFQLNSGEKVRAIEYVADFKIKHDDDVFFIDSKGILTTDFKLKMKLWKKLYWNDHYLIIAKSIKELELKLSI